MKKQLLALALCIGTAFGTSAQTGIGTITPDSSAMLDVTSPGNDKGVLIPRMTTAQRDAITRPANGLVIFNTETGCFDYYSDGTGSNVTTSAWYSNCGTNGGSNTAGGSVGGAGGTCTSATVNGTYQTNTATDNTNNVVLQVTVTSPGSYSITTGTVNGVTFSGSGIFTNAGTQNVTLMANGTPNAAGTFSYPATFNGTTCTFQVTATLGAAVGTINCSGTANGVYTAGEPVGSYNTKVISVDVTTAGTYNFTTNTVNGYSFSTSGTFAATGTQNVTLTATGTPTNAGTNTFTISGTGGSTCTFPVTVKPSKYYVFAQAPAGTLTQGNYVSWTSLANRNISVSGNSVNLKGGHTYRLTAAMYISGTNGVILYDWTDAAGTILPYNVRGQAIVMNLATGANDNSQPSATAVISPSSDITVRVKVALVNGTASTDGRSYLIAEEIPATSQYALAKGVASTTLSTTSNIQLTNVTNNPVNASTPSSITFSGNKITLKAGKTYKLVASLYMAGTAATYCGYWWVNASTGAQLPNTSRGMSLSVTGTQVEGANPYSVCIITPAADMDVALRPTYVGGGTTITDVRTYAYVEEIAAGTHYLNANATDQTWSTTTAHDFTFTVGGTSGDITLTGGTQFTLKAGRTYELFGANYMSNADYVGLQWVNSSNTQLSSSTGGQTMSVSFNSAESPNPTAISIIKPSADMVVKFRSHYGAFNGGASTAGTSSSRTAVLITEL